MLVVEENTRMNDCYFDKRDWRACKDEVSLWGYTGIVREGYVVTTIMLDLRITDT